MRILLLNPNRSKEGMLHVDPVLTRCVGIPAKAPYLWPPMGLAYLAGYLRQRHDAEFLDAQAEGLEEEQILERLSHEFVIINTGTPTIESDLMLASRIREKGARTALIGTHATYFHRELAMKSGVDFIIRGEPELPSMGLADSLESGCPLSSVRGLTWKSRGRVAENPGSKPVTRLDDMPFSVRDMIPNRRYYDILTRESPPAFVISSRGCPFSCRFCASGVYNGRVFRARTSNNVLEEARELSEKGFRDITFIDDTFTIDRERVLDICRGMKELGLSWRCLSRVDTVDREMLRVMKDSGCYQIQFGVESGDQDTLDSMGKGISLSQIRRAFRECRRLGIETVAFFMIGYPGETKEEIQMSVSLAGELKPDFVSFNVFTPLPGSEDYESVIQKKDWKDFNFTSTSFSDIASDEIYSIAARAYKGYYIRPSYIARRVIKTREPFRILKQNLRFWTMRKGTLWTSIRGTPSKKGNIPEEK